MKRHRIKAGLETKVLCLTVSLLCMMATVILASGYYFVKVFVNRIVGDDLQRECELVESLLSNHDGETRLVMLDADGNIYYGVDNETLEQIQTLLEEMKEHLEIEISFIYRNVRVLTTMVDENGNSLTGTQISAVVQRDVQFTGEPKFYANAEVFGARKYVYYAPVKDKEGTMLGIIGISKDAKEIQETVQKIVYSMVFLCGLLILISGIISVRAASRLIHQLGLIQNFLGRVADGKLTEGIDNKLLHQKDELGALAMIGVSMQKSLRNLIEKDALTDLNNRRYATNRLQQNWNKYQKNGVAYSICICDIDFFKKVNDTYGHEVGDEVLKAVAKILLHNMVGKGFAARWGGEEFLLVFEAGEYYTHVECLEKILKEVRELEVRTKGDDSIRVTMTMGIDRITMSKDNDMALMEADKRLYYGKTHGRNQIVDKTIFI